MMHPASRRVRLYSIDGSSRPTCTPSARIAFATAGWSVTTIFFFSSRRRHTRSDRDWSSDVCSSDLSEERRVGKECRAEEGMEDLNENEVQTCALTIDCEIVDKR